jgi:hypothetical protein
MATTINGGFAGLSANLEITTLQKSTTSTRQQNVREAMEKGFTVLDSFLSGSYARFTMIGPLSDSDIDIFVILDPAYWAKYKASPADLLESARQVLLQTYTMTPKIKPDGQAVTITFTDFVVDVVPAFNRSGGGYLIPNASRGWIETNPTVHADVLTAQNKAHAGDLVPLVKMIKGWNRANGDTLSGFYLELMTTDILNNVTISSFSSGVRYVFDKGREKIKFKQLDPAGLANGQVNPLKTGTLEAAVARFTKAHDLALQAEALASVDKISAATDKWREIFGGYFPAYG